MQGRIGAQVCSSHFKLKKHKDGIERLVRKGKQDKDIEEAFTAYNKEEHLVGTAATNDTQVYRVKVVTAFLKAGIPLNKLGILREILEENSLRLAGWRTMSDRIPFIHQQKVTKMI